METNENYQSENQPSMPDRANSLIDEEQKSSRPVLIYPESNNTLNSSENIIPGRNTLSTGMIVKIIIALLAVVIFAVLAVVLIGFINGYADNEKLMKDYCEENNYSTIYQNAVSEGKDVQKDAQAENENFSDDSDIENISMEANRTKQLVYPDNTVRNLIPEIDALREANSEIIGVLTINGVLQEKVVLTNYSHYYLSHNAEGSSDTGGAVYAEDNCSIDIPPENLLLRGSVTEEGKCFSALLCLRSRDNGMMEMLNTARLTTLYEDKTYQLFAIIFASCDPESIYYFDYASHPQFSSDEEMMNYVKQVQNRSLYQFSVNVEPADRLLTIATVTLDGSSEGEFVLFYRMTRDYELTE